MAIDATAVSATFLRDRSGKVNIMVETGDAPACLAAGVGGYLHPRRSSRRL